MDQIKECVKALNTERANQQLFWFERLTALVQPTIMQNPQLKLEDFLDERWEFVASTIK